MKFIDFDRKTIRLSSGLSEESFAKTKFSALLGEKGLVAKAELAGDSEREGFPAYEWTSSESTFSSIKSDEEGKVYYEGEFDFLPADGSSKENPPLALADLQDDKTSAHVDEALLVCAAITYAAKNKIRLPLNGGGILISRSEASIRLIFLPQKIFFNSASGAGTELFTRYIGFYKIPLLAHEESRLFMQAAITYRALAKSFPFAKENADERMADIRDKNFLPIEYAVDGISAEAAGAINDALSQGGHGNQPDYAALHQKLLKAFLDSAKKAEAAENQESENFKKRAQEYARARKAQVERRRRLRRNSAKIIAAAAAFAILLAFAFSAARSSAEQPTTIGLTPAQVTELFFQSINEKDVQLMMAASKGRQFKPYVSAVTNMHVANAASQAYTFSSANVKPEKWFFYATDEISAARTSIYGITNLSIEGYSSILDAKATRKKDKPMPLLPPEQKNITKALELSYYIVQENPDDGAIEAELAQGSVTLTYLKNRWVLTGIDVSATPLPFQTQEFKSDYYAALKAADGAVITAAQSLALRYQWIPASAVMEAAERELKEGF